MATVATTSIKVTPGGSFNFFGLTITKLEFDAATLRTEKAALSEGDALAPTALPKGFVPVSVLPPVGATASVTQTVTSGVATYAVSVDTIVQTFVGKIEILVLGHF